MGPPSSPRHPNKERSGCHRSWGPTDPTSRSSLSRPPLPVVALSPGVPISWGLSPQVPHFRLSLPLRGPFPRPSGPRTGSRALTGPATGRSAGQSAAGASSGSTRKTTRTPPARPRPRAGSDVPGRAKTGSTVSAQVRSLAAVWCFGSTWRPEPARWHRSQRQAGWEEGRCPQVQMGELGKPRPRGGKNIATVRLVCYVYCLIKSSYLWKLS